MRILIVEDDPTSRFILQRFISPYGDINTAEDGNAALEAFQAAHQQGKPYDLIFLDIMLPKMDGQNVLINIRQMEHEKGIGGREGVKIIMTTALDDHQNILGAFNEQCEAYLVKPIDKDKLIKQLKALNLI